MRIQAEEPVLAQFFPLHLCLQANRLPLLREVFGGDGRLLRPAKERLCSLSKQTTMTRNHSGAFKTKQQKKSSPQKKKKKRKRAKLGNTERAFSASSLAFSPAIRVPFAEVQTGFIGKDNTRRAKPQHPAASQAQETRELHQEPELSRQTARSSG